MNAAFALYALLAAVIWYGLIGRVTWTDTVLGLAPVLTGWVLFRRAMGQPPPLPWRHVGRFVGGLGAYLLFHVLPDMVWSTLRVFLAVVDPRAGLRPAIVAVHLPGVTTAGLVMVAYGISLTPGQQLVAMDEGLGILYIHALDVPDPAALQRQIQATYRRFLQEASQW